MSDSDRLLLKLLSLLLHFPDDLLLHALPDLETLAARVSERSAEIICRRFLPYLKAAPLLLVQEFYTQTFDFNPDACLCLTWLRWGEKKERGADLARLVGIYRDAGYERLSGDLPDYLPLLLEFASICPNDSGLALLREFNPEIQKIHLYLHKSQNPYAGLFTLLAEALGVQ